jgi:membrane dipeptidase
MNIKTISASLAGLILCLGARPASQVRADGAEAYKHVQYLASDDLKGRKAGTPEYAKAADYIAAKMKEYGLQPGGGNGSWFQEVPFKNWSNFDLPERLEITAPERRVYFAGRGRDFQPARGTGSGIARGGAAFVGYGIVSEKPAWDDYAGLDVKGRVLVFLPDSPPGFDDPGLKTWTLEKKVKLAVERGAAGVIEMDTGEPGQARPRRRIGAMIAPGVCPPGFVVIQATANFLDDLFYLSKKSWRDPVSRILRLKKPLSFALDAAIEMEAHYIQEERQAVNVIGIIPGRDKKLKNECLIMGGHLDHLGVGVNGFVYPGADDNATSAAAILETARVLAASRFKPARTIIFASWAGEEQGMVGSRYYTDHPAFPLNRTAAYLNVDMVGAGGDDLLVGGMWEYGRFYDIVKAGLDPEIVKRLRPRINYRGSDHTSFWNKGVTAISLRTGKDFTLKPDDEHPEYHRPGDRPELIDPEHLRVAAQYHVEALRTLANSKENLLGPGFRAEFVHKDAAVADLHCDTISRFMAGADLRQDLPEGNIDIPKLKRGAVDLQVFACYVGPPADDLEKAGAAKKAFDEIEAVDRLVGQNPDDLEVVLTYEDAARLRNTGKTAVLIGIEGGYAIEDDLDLLRAFHRAGVRLMTLTHWTHTDWADASGDPAPTYGGLTEFGEKVVQEMNRLGMVVDVSHAHDETFWDVMRVSTAPVVASHSCCRALSDYHRNLTDDMLKALAKNGGMIGINFLPGFLNAEIEKRQTALHSGILKKYGLADAEPASIMRADPATREKIFAEFRVGDAELAKTLPRVDVGTVVDHIDHVVKVVGNADHVGLGSDFDGISATPVGLENAGKLGAITEELQRRGYKEDDIRKILGGNFYRIFEAVQKAAKS